MSDIWVITEAPQLGWEMIGRARELAAERNCKVSAYIAGDEAAGLEAVARGADEVALLPQLDRVLWEDYAPLLAELAGAAGPLLIMVGGTRRGRDLAGRMAALLDVPCVPNCKSIVMDASGKAVITRMVFGGLALKTMTCETSPLMITVAPKTFEALEADLERRGPVVTLDAPREGPVQVIERLPKEKETVNLADAEIVIGIGRGFAEESEISLARELAEALGAEIACTRPIAEFFKWLPEDRYVGISGQVIKPRLYLAVGISGQIQHLSGIRDANTIAAVNVDENAPIFQEADYGLVGDLKEVLPALLASIRQLRM